jgi:hypothetical protein
MFSHYEYNNDSVEAGEVGLGNIPDIDHFENAIEDIADVFVNESTYWRIGHEWAIEQRNRLFRT